MSLETFSSWLICLINHSNNATLLTSRKRGSVRKLKKKSALRIHYESLSFLNKDRINYLEHLFSHTLGISDCKLGDYVEELKSLRDSGFEDSDDIHILYREINKLWRMGISPQMSQELRGQFEDHNLIYIPSNDGASWRKTSQCVWSIAARLRDLVSLHNEYEDLEDFFVSKLEVRPVTLSMAIDELKEAGSRQSVSIDEVTASIRTVNSLLRSDPEPEKPAGLEDSKIFPVRYRDGGVKCVSSKTQFFIVDREPLRSLFEGRVKFLDFSLEEVVQLHTFLNWAQLGERCISRCVREFTSVQSSSGQPISQPDRQFRHRAHAILRYVLKCHITMR